MALAARDGDAPSAPLSPTPAADRPSSPSRATITVGAPQQRFAGWGAGVVTETAIDPLADPELSPDVRRRLDQLVFGGANIRLLRIWSPAFGYGTRGQRTRLSAADGRFRLMRRARRHGVRFMLTGATAPEAWKTGKALDNGRERAYARSLADVLTFAERRVRVPFDYVAIGNEVDNPRLELTMTPAQTRIALRELTRLIALRGLRTRIVLGDNLGWPQASRYVQEQATDRTLARRAAAVASHAYAGQSGDRVAFARLAERLDRPVWMTEWTTGCPTGACPDNADSRFAQHRASQITFDLAEAAAAAWFLFRPAVDTSHAADDGLAVLDAGELHISNRYWVFRQFAHAAGAGWRVRTADVAGAPLHAVAFTHGRKRSVVVTNPTSSAVAVTVALGRGRLSARRTAPGENFARVDIRRDAGGQATFAAPPHSVTTVRLAPSRR